MMLHTFSTLGCPEMDLDGAIGLAARHGLHSLELRTLNNTTDLPAWFESHYGSPAGLAAHLKQRHVKVCALGTSFKLVGHDDIDRAQLEMFVRWADEADVPWLRVFDGGKRVTPTRSPRRSPRSNGGASNASKTTGRWS